MDSPVDAPRVHHDLFSHLALPRTFLRDPAVIMGILASKDAMEFLRGMWGVIEKELEPAQRLSVEGLRLEHYSLEDDVFVAMVTMPPATRFREALFVALVARLAEPRVERCLSLELVGPPGPDAPTAICEWSSEAQPKLIDEKGCAPTAAAFADAVERIVRKPASPT